MFEIDLCTTPFEFKAVGDGATGEFEGYGAVFGNVDWHGDVIAPGAFKDGLAERKAAGRRVAMHLEHGLPQLGGRKNVGTWPHIAEDSKGLHVKGKIAGMNTDSGRLLYEQAREGALPGLSIGYAVRPGGARFGKGAGEPKRTLLGVNLVEISLVGDPSNTEALATQFKTLMQHADVDAATRACGAAMMLHRSSMSGGDAPTKDERSQLLQHLGDIHEALTGSREPKGFKAVPSTLREFEDALREIGFSRTQAALLAERGFKSTGPRDAGAGEASPAADGIGDILASIRLA